MCIVIVIISNGLVPRDAVGQCWTARDTFIGNVTPIHIIMQEECIYSYTDPIRLVINILFTSTTP